VLLAGLLRLWRTSSDVWVFYAVTTIVGPGLLLFATDREGVYFVRYFLIAIVFLLLMLSQILSQLYRSGRFGKTAYILVVIAILFGNGHHVEQLIRLHRGSYRVAILMIQQQSLESPITISGDHDGRTDFMVDFFWRRLPEPLPLVYIERDRRPPKGSEWFLQHSFEPDTHSMPTFKDSQGNRYRLVREYPFAGLSGWHGSVYHNENRTNPR
jgi:hypothetical protein